jgi:acyl carrier protein
MMTEKEIYDRLAPLLVEVLGVEPKRITPGSGLVRDLGAESIDLLDLSFRIEEEFKISLEANEVEKEARLRLPGGVYEKDGFLTEEAIAGLPQLIPEVDRTRLVAGLRKTDVPALLTVAFFVRLIARKLAQPTGEAGHA